MSDRRTGKIARLPYEVRTVVNIKLRDGRPYAEIIDYIASEGHGKDFNEQNLTNWSQGGHQDWLKEQARLEEMKAKREFAMEIVKANDGSKLHEANLHLAASQIYDVLTDFDPARLKALLDEKPENYAAITNSLAKLSKGAMEVQKYRDANERALKLLDDAKKNTDGSGGLSAETIEKIERELKLL
jgi:hypothetical protein